MSIAGIILAGGLARRMGGGDKALLEVAGRPLLGHVIDRLGPQVVEMALNANGDPSRFAGFGLPVIGDTVEGFVGPLGGVLAGMRWAAERGHSHVVSAAADTPFFPADLVARLSAAKGDQPIAMAATEDPERGLSEHPTFALWPVDLADDLEYALTEGQMRKVIVWTSRHGCARATFEGDYPFFNVNTPEDLAEAERIAGTAPGAIRRHGQHNVYGVVGWKNAGKTTLVERLVAEICGRGFSVSTVKHTHHLVDVDQPGKDSHRHRQAGARQVILSSSSRWAIMTELRGEPEVPLAELLSHLSPVDLVIVEGYKRDDHPKVEAWRAATGQPLIALDDPTVRAVASNDRPATDKPVIGLDDIPAIADFILADLGLTLRKTA